MQDKGNRRGISKVRRERSAAMLQGMLARDGRNGREVSRRLLKTHARIAGTPLKKYCAQEQKAIQRFAISHDLQEVDCKPPTVKFKNPDNGELVYMDIEELMEFDTYERRTIRDSNKEKRAQQRVNVERLL